MPAGALSFPISPLFSRLPLTSKAVVVSASRPLLSSSSSLIRRHCRLAFPCFAIPGPSPSSASAPPGNWDDKFDPSQYEVLLKGGEQVTSVMQEMITLLEDMEMDAASEAAAVEIAAQGVIGKRVDEMETGFIMALDYMLQQAETDQDEQRKTLLEVIKQTVLDHLAKKCPPHVQVVGLLCRTPQKDSRHELLRRVAAGGGVFKGEEGAKVQLPGANLNDIANQADDLIETMEVRSIIPDRKLLARLVLIREETRNMMGGGLLDERNDRGLNTLPEAEVNFLAKLVALKPGNVVYNMIKNVMRGKDEGADPLNDGDKDTETEQISSGGIAGRFIREVELVADLALFGLVCSWRPFPRCLVAFTLETYLVLQLNI